MTAHTVYALCDETGFVIYIGCTSDLKRRVKSHQTTDDGCRHSKAIALIEFDDRADALEHERELIEALQPAENFTFNPPYLNATYNPLRGPGDPRHGTRGAYRHKGCRCGPCVTANTKAAAARLERQKASLDLNHPDEAHRHGKYTTYATIGCRCPKCYEAGRQYRAARASASRAAA